MAPERSTSIHASHEGSDLAYLAEPEGVDETSIHASHEGSDLEDKRDKSKRANTSIHASHEGSDLAIATGIFLDKHFNPRFP